MIGYWLFLAVFGFGPALLLRYFTTHPLEGARMNESQVDRIIRQEITEPRRKQEKEGSK